MAFSLNRVQQKVGLGLLARCLLSCLCVVIGRAVPGHMLLIALSLLFFFHLFLIPFWPKRWTYAPEIDADGFVYGWRQHLPKAARVALLSVALVAMFGVLTLWGYLVYTECVRPLI